MASVRKLDHIVAFFAVVPDLDERNNFSEQRMVGPSDPDRLKN
jgi:hypothetical protein